MQACRHLARVVVLVSLGVIGPLAAGAQAAGINGVGWTDIGEEAVGTSGQRRVVPAAGRVLALDAEALARRLAEAPMETDSDADAWALTVDLPRPDGGWASFSVVESPVMEPELAARYPSMTTYRGQGIDDQTATVRFDMTRHGFHAMVLSTSGSWFIDPYQTGDTAHYISYFKRDLQDVHAPDFACQVEGSGFSGATGEPGGAGSGRSGSILRSYRIAVAATGEYTIFHGGSVADGMAAIVTAMNRVNGIYERDVAIRMVLVANNDLVVYTNPATDPYSNSNGGAMLGQNQINLTQVIGPENYDIGHVFSTGGGGIAYLGVPCRDAYKALGVTGLPQPIGDPFYVDYVAHELGHQWNANHTFNGNAGSCAGGNRNPSTAFEPGSGTTIMAYAGICGSQDIQVHSDEVFHGVSFTEIVDYSTAGAGATCAEVISTGNIPPSAEAGPGAVIPANTPFALCGSAVDANGHRMTYSWEEFDLGPAGHPDEPEGNAAIFRSFLPLDSPQRVFPRNEDLLANTHTIGEILPTYSRDLEFRFTARDNRSGGGGVGHDSTSLVVTDEAGPFLVTSPTTNVTWSGGELHTVMWSPAGTDLPPVDCATVDIELSLDGGWNFPIALAAATPNDGSEPVRLPDVATDMARVRVGCHGNVFFSVSSTNFTIDGGGYLFAEGWDGCGAGWGGWSEVVE